MEEVFLLVSEIVCSVVWCVETVYVIFVIFFSSIEYLVVFNFFNVILSFSYIFPRDHYNFLLFIVSLLYTIFFISFPWRHLYFSDYISIILMVIFTTIFNISNTACTTVFWNFIITSCTIMLNFKIIKTFNIWPS